MGGHDGPTEGPATSRLLSFGRVQGWVSGAFGEASPDLHRLLDLFARKDAAANHVSMGLPSPLQARPHVKQRCCRELGIMAVRTAAQHKLQALATVLMGKQAAAQQTKRRQSQRNVHRARNDSYFAQHSFYADDLPRRPWAADL